MSTEPRAAVDRDALILAALRDTLDEVLSAALDGRRRAVVLDAPAYRNAGDLLILRGTLSSLRRLGVKAVSVQDWTLTSWTHLEGLAPDVAVLLQGGGNFGGLYPEHDDYRARVLSTLRDPSAAIVMPQSVNFPDQQSRERGRQLYGSFNTATFLVRDSRSATVLRDTISQIADSVQLCPDAAFGTSLTSRHLPTCDVFILQREDAESTRRDLTVATRGLGLDFLSGDWPSFGRAFPSYRALRKLMSLGERGRRAVRQVPRPVGSIAVSALERAWQPPQQLLLRAHAADHVHQIRRTVERGRLLVTDRLHGHVAASLMGVPNIALDNADGKVGALINEWTKGLSTTHFAQTPDDAHDQLIALFRGGPDGSSAQRDG